MKNIKVISFDIGGTLVYDIKESWEILYECLLDLNYYVEKEKIKEAWEKSVLWWREIKIKEKVIWTEKMLEKVIQIALENLGIKYNENLIKILIELRLNKRSVKLYDDVLYTLEYLKKEKYRLIVISNSLIKTAVRTLTNLGIINYFEKLIISEEVGYEKPHPNIFHIALERCGVSNNEMIHIGNEYEADYEGATNLGIIGVLLDRNNKYKNKECLKINNLYEIINLLNNF